MLYAGNSEVAQVLLPTEDYNLAVERERKVDLSRVQMDIEERRIR